MQVLAQLAAEMSKEGSSENKQRYQKSG